MIFVSIWGRDGHDCRRNFLVVCAQEDGVLGAVTEQLAGAARRCNSEAKAKGRKEQLEETEEQ